MCVCVESPELNFHAVTVGSFVEALIVRDMLLLWVLYLFCCIRTLIVSLPCIIEGPSVR